MMPGDTVCWKAYSLKFNLTTFIMKGILICPNKHNTKEIIVSCLKSQTKNQTTHTLHSPFPEYFYKNTWFHRDNIKKSLTHTSVILFEKYNESLTHG